MPREDAIGPGITPLAKLVGTLKKVNLRSYTLDQMMPDKGNRSVPEKSTMETPKSASARKIGTEYTSSFDDETMVRVPTEMLRAKAPKCYC